MKKQCKYLILLTLLLNTDLLLSATVYEQNFDSGTMPPVSTANPVWSLTPIFEGLYGKGNQFFVTDTTSHSGSYSLKISYDGRNGFCNTCGSYGVTHQQGLDNVDYFLAKSGEDLTATENNDTVKKNDGPAAQSGRLLYNKSNGFSLWKIQSVENANATNDKLTVKLLRPGITGETPEFSSNHEIAIARQCGVDGHIGNDIKRRNDCDAAIVWFSNVATQTHGSSIFRRMYLKAEITNPIIHQKLHYFRPGNDAAGNPGEIVLFADSSQAPHNIQPQISGLAAPNNDVFPIRNYGAGSNFYKPGNGLDANLQFKRGVWYYIEEQYKAQSAPGDPNNPNDPGAADGEYRLWFAESGKENTDGATPILERTGLTLPPIDFVDAKPKISFWGNIQHWTHTHGNWYMDDVKIAITDTKLGPAQRDPTNKDVFSPKFPDVSTQ